MKPSLPDQAAFQEGFADVVALLSVFALPETIRRLIAGDDDSRFVDEAQLTPESLRQSTLFGLAKQMGSALSGIRGQALRRSVECASNGGLCRVHNTPRRDDHAKSAKLPSVVA